MRESQKATIFGSKGRSYSTEKVVVPVVMESEIQTLDDLRGYFVQLDKVVRIALKPRAKRVRGEGLVERLVPFARPVPPEPEPVRAARPKSKKRPLIEEAPGLF
jgi:hypothetical protein